LRDAHERLDHAALRGSLFVVVAVLSLLPLTRLIWEGLAPGGTASTSALVRVLTDASTWTATAHSLVTAFGGTLVAVVIGAIVALVVTLTDMRARSAFVFFFVLHLVAPGGMGFGDVRLSAVLGLFLGWLGGMYVFGGLFLGFLLGAVIGSVLIAVGRRGRKQHIPFGPFLAAGTMIFVLFGEPIVSWWQGFGR